MGIIGFYNIKISFGTSDTQFSLQFLFFYLFTFAIDPKIQTKDNLKDNYTHLGIKL